jgi:hypothetical protein
MKSHLYSLTEFSLHIRDKVSASNVNELAISNLSAPITDVKTVNNLRLSIIQRTAHFTTSTPLPIIVKTMMTKKMKTMFPINFVMKSLTTISAEMERGEMSWENLSMIKSPTENFYLFIRFDPHSIKSLKAECTLPMPPSFLFPTSTIFIIVFSILLIIAWIVLILWVHSVITRGSIHDKPDDIELAAQG